MDERIDINKATAEELTALPGVGEALAERIVAHRQRVGRFKSVDDLLHVSGISQRLLENLRPHIKVDDAPAGHAERLTVVVGSDPAGADFTGHTVMVQGTKDVDDGDGPLPFGATGPLPRDGSVELSIPSRAHLVGEVTTRVIAPDGVQLASARNDGPNLPERIEIVVNPREYGTTQPNTDPAAGKPTRIRGRVIDAAGKRPPAEVQVVLWGATAEEPQDQDFRALIVATTDRVGHFTGPYPLGSFTRAHATVAVGDEPVTVNVHLEGGSFPEFVLLVVDVPDHDEHDEEDDCACKGGPEVPRSPDSTELARADGTFSSDPGAGRCVDFTKPDRTLEEFTFTYLVRTTEPDIRGFTLEEPSKIDPGRIKDILRVEAAHPQGRALRAKVGDAGPAEEGGAAVAGQEAVAPAVRIPLEAQVLKRLARDPDGFSLTSLADAAHLTRHGDLMRLIGATLRRPSGRRRLTCDDPLDWDEDITVSQACTIAHGHILRFKQEWVADGYSMGNLLYSLPLAPGQKKQLAVVDWERRESAGRTEEVEAREALQAALERDRDISEIVSGTVNESTRGGSHSSGGSIAGGLGVAGVFGAVGGVLGIGGGFSSADSSAWQTSSRNTAANALNQLRDRTIQSASAVRSQRTSVVQTVRQGERVTATTETVANYNHCHAITVQYFEVLRHVLVRQRLVDVQECLFVPLLMSWFTADKARRWSHTLGNAVPGRLRGGFAALDRIAHNYVGSDLPTGRYADETLESVDGELRLRFQLTRPRDKDEQFDANTWAPLLKLFGFDPQDFYDNYLKDQQFKDRVFLEHLGSRIASSVVGALQVTALRADGSGVNLGIDPTLITRFANDQSLYVTLRMSSNLPPVARAEIKAILISARLARPGNPLMVEALPAGSRVIVESGTVRYRTAHHSDALFRDAFVQNDLTGYDDVRIEAPLNRQELRNPREEDKELARNLLQHLNEHIEPYHHRLWAAMSPDRRYMLLDGFEAPNSGGRSVASVVDNELIGIVGNCLVLAVARGFHLDPTFKQDVENPIDLLDHYQPNTPIEPSRVAVPTRGVYAEAVMGACNSCEVKDETRFWRWEESPLPDSPPPILPVSTDTRRSEPPDLTAKDLPAPIVAMQSAPAAPDPTGLGAILQLLGQAGIFKDITGLEGTQRNAAAALESAFQTATTMGTKAADLALQGKMAKDIDRAMRTIQTARSQGLISDEQASNLSETAIRGMVGAGATNPPAATTTEEVSRLTERAGENNAAVRVTRPTGEQVEVDARPTGGPEDSGRPIIILSSDTSSAENRAFRPSTNDKSGVITVRGRFRNAPEGSRLRWSSPEAGTLQIDTPNAEQTRVRGLRPGKRDLDVELLDAGGTRISSMKLHLSVPQYIRITEEAAAFNTALSDVHLSAVKNDVIAHAKQAAEELLRTSNVRLYWQVGGLNEAVPAHVPATSLMTVTLRNTDPSNVLGHNNLPGGVNLFNETIDLFPGAYDDPDAIDVDTETQALVIQLESSLSTNPALEQLAAKVYGRLIGETMAHEIVHGLIWDEVNPGGADPFHHSPAVANDLMNAGSARLFRQRTGMENTRQVSPVEPSHYVDHGLGTIGHLQPVTQALVNNHFPVAAALP